MTEKELCEKLKRAMHGDFVVQNKVKAVCPTNFKEEVSYPEMQACVYQERNRIQNVVAEFCPENLAQLRGNAQTLRTIEKRAEQSYRILTNTALVSSKKKSPRSQNIS